MMLTTRTWLPPIWRAMLPQKFSAATTSIWLPRPPEPADTDAAGAVEQPTTAASTKLVSTATTIAGPGRLSRQRRTDDRGLKGNLLTGASRRLAGRRLPSGCQPTRADNETGHRFHIQLEAA